MLKHQRKPGIAKAFLRIPKPIRIYFGVILGVALVFGSINVINEMQSRMTPPDQLLFMIEEKTQSQQTGFLKIFAVETTADVSGINFNGWEVEYDEKRSGEEIPIERRRVSEMQFGVPVSVGSERKVRYAHHSQYVNGEWKSHAVFSDIVNSGYPYSNNARSAVLYIIAEADAYLEVTGPASLYDMSSSDFSFKDLKSEVVKNGGNMYHITAGYRPRHETNGPERDPDEELGTGIWNGESRKRYYIQTLDEVYPEFAYPDEIEGMPVYAHTSHERKVSESAILISAYDKSNPNILLAQAEIKLTFHSGWQGFPSLQALGLHTNPDNYGYTTAEIVDYWENYDYTDYTVK